MRIRRGVAATFGVLSLVAALGLFAARWLPVVNHPVLVAALVAPLALLAAPVSAVLFAMTRRWILAAMAALATVVIAGAQLPAFVAASAPASALTVRVMSLNMHLGQADPAAIVAVALREADVLALQELTPAVAAGLSAAGLDTAFPHRLIDPRAEASGIGLWTRNPLSDTGHVDGYHMPGLMARVDLPGPGPDPMVAVLHMAAPWPQPAEDWRGDMALLPTTLTHLADVARDGAVLVAGDFNSTTDMRQFRDVLTNGYRDAAEQAGVAFLPTYPSNVARPLIAIDHVLTKGATATALDTAYVPGTDHRALVVDAAVAR